MPLAAVTAATCLSAAVGSFLMGGFARYPIALAPGMGLNAYFTYTVVKGMGIPWQAALGAVFLSGVAFLLLTAAGRAAADHLRHPVRAVRRGGGGRGPVHRLHRLPQFRHHRAQPGHHRHAGQPAADKSTALALFGLLLIAALLAWRVRAAMLIGILATTVVGLVTGVAKWTPQSYRLGDLSATACKLDVARHAAASASSRSSSSSCSSTCSTTSARWWRWARRPTCSTRRTRSRASTASCSPTPSPPSCGSLTGTSTVVSYIESAAGVAAGGRTGVTAIVTGLLFVAALFVAPVVGAIPAAATAPALIIVGSLMMSGGGGDRMARSRKWPSRPSSP